MTEQEMYSRVHGIILSRLGAGDIEVSEKTDFFNDLGADSFDMVDVELSIEKEFDVKFESMEIVMCRNIGDIINVLHKRNIS